MLGNGGVTGHAMKDWNVVVSVHEQGFVRACELLEELGPISRTDYYNVLVMKVADIRGALEVLRQWVAEDRGILGCISRFMPVTRGFAFQTAQEFETKAADAVLGLVPDLAGKAFHVRMHRRGFKGLISSQTEERFLDDILLQALERAGTPGRITFEDPDAIVAVETVGGQAGVSLWTREALERYPYLQLC